jgi:myo-inositol-1-phosphate synthase
MRHSLAKTSQNLGLWLIGACGGVGTTVALGIEAIRRKLAAPTGLLDEQQAFRHAGLAPLTRWVVGGHEIRRVTFEESARELHRLSGIFSPEVIDKCRPWLRQCDRNVRDGTLLNCGPTIGRMADRRGVRKKLPASSVIATLADDILSFQKRHRLRHVVVVNVASTEAPLAAGAVHQKWPGLSKALGDRRKCVLPASSLYALAAIEAGASYINFTPSAGIDVPAILERAGERGTAYMGADGKTGETLMKSVLAPMFAARNLHVLSWVGHNIFGNRDGLVLDDPKIKAAKTRSNDHLVGRMLGYKPKTLVSIEFIESMGDWKTAWDHIHFEGFLGTKMALQFIWQGCDSILAAPLVIDLARLAELAARRGEGGPLKQLACFFKSPMGVVEQAFARQYEELLAYVRDADAG